MSVRRRPARRVGGIAPLLVVALACAGGDGPAAARTAVHTDSAGIDIAANDSVDRPLAWRFEERFAVGGAESGPEAFYGVSARGVGVDTLGRLYILDAGNHRVVVVDSAGQVVRTQGAQGGGPGELEFPAFLAVRPDGEVGVYDYARGGLVRFAPDGAPLPLERVTAEGGPPPDAMRWVDGGLLLARTDYGDDRVRDELLVRRGEAETVLATTESPSPPMHTFRSCGGRLAMRLPPLFQPQMTWSERDGRIVAATNAAYTLDVYDGDRRVASVRRSLPPRASSEELARRELGEGMKVRFGGGDCTVDPAEVIEARGLAPVLPAVRTVVVAPDGTVWVERGRLKDEPPLIDVFDRSGDYLGTLPAGSPMPAAFQANGDLVAIVTDELEVQRVVTYRVARAEAAPR